MKPPPNTPEFARFTEALKVMLKVPKSEDALSECGIRVEFLCPAEIEAKYKQKIKNG
jgi:hypothetical protein